MLYKLPAKTGHRGGRIRWTRTAWENEPSDLDVTASSAGKFRNKGILLNLSVAIGCRGRSFRLRTGGGSGGNRGSWDTGRPAFRVARTAFAQPPVASRAPQGG